MKLKDNTLVKVQTDPLLLKFKKKPKFKSPFEQTDNSGLTIHSLLEYISDPLIIDNINQE